MRIVVFGAGYVGLVTGTCLAEHGNSVLMVDVDERRVANLRAGQVPIHEPGLGALIKRNVRSDRLAFASRIEGPFNEADFYFIAVGTPPAKDGSADTSAVMAATETVVATARSAAVLVVKSTVPIGTCDAIAQRIARARTDLEVVSNPEFLKEGSAILDFFRADRIVIGGASEAATERLRQLYEPIQPGARFVITDRRSSELIKYAANSMLAMRISFMNEMARLCHATGANIHDVRLGVGSDERIGPRFLFAGPGYGGSCFPKDVQALAMLGRKHGVVMGLAEMTHESNEKQVEFIVQQIVAATGGDLQGKTVAFWGLSFKPETDDVRDAPSVRVARRLVAAGARVVGYDPEAGSNFMSAMDTDHVRVVDRQEDALDDADVLVLLTEWRCFRAPNFKSLRKRMRGTSVVDARNIWSPAAVRDAGLRYCGIGVP